jgi:hypothetical protein
MRSVHTQLEKKQTPLDDRIYQILSGRAAEGDAAQQILCAPQRRYSRAKRRSTTSLRILDTSLPNGNPRHDTLT